MLLLGIRQVEMPKIEQAKKEEEERRKGKVEKQEQKETRAQTFRIALALGIPRKKIASMIGLKNEDTVNKKKRDEGALGRKEIVALLSKESDDFEIAKKAGINEEYAYIITQIREEEKSKEVKGKTKAPAANQKDMPKSQVKTERRKQSTTVKKQTGNNGIENIKSPQDEEGLAQKDVEEDQFLRMARNYETIEKMEGVLGINRYEIILKLKGLGFYIREDIERLIENSNMTDKEIAGKNGNIIAIKRIRRMINQREKLINSVPVEKRGKIISKLSSNLDVRFIADTMRVSPEAIKAMREKWKRDKEQMTTEQKRKNLKVEITQFEIKVRTIGKENSKKALTYMINKMLVIYEGALEPIHYACFAYAYMKTGEYLQAIEFAEEYLNLQNSSSSGVIDKINEVLESEKKKGENLNTSRNMRAELMTFVGIGE